MLHVVTAVQSAEPLQMDTRRQPLFKPAWGAAIAMFEVPEGVGLVWIKV